MLVQAKIGAKGEDSIFDQSPLKSVGVHGCTDVHWGDFPRLWSSYTEGAVSKLQTRPRYTQV